MSNTKKSLVQPLRYCLFLYYCALWFGDNMVVWYHRVFEMDEDIDMMLFVWAFNLQTTFICSSVLFPSHTHTDTHTPIPPVSAHIPACHVPPHCVSSGIL